MHIDYAKEMVERVEKDLFLKGNQQHMLTTVADEREILNLVAKVGDDKHRDIAATMAEIKKDGGRYRKVTSKQKAAVALFLLEKFGTARAALAAAFGKTEAEMFNA